MYNQQANRAEAEQQFHGDPRGRGYSCGHGRRWGWGRHRHGGWPAGRLQLVPVNIEDAEDRYVLSLFAAGLVKDNFALTVKDDVLTIAYQGPEEPADAAATSAYYTRREFRNASFERSFQLNGKVVPADITAQYTDGILTVILPKNPATTQPAQAIKVS
ncbi:Hsp20/alpha crystallin family protein [Hymenobacter sp. GOD-10R]|uniref:Hsp20/alpha crystallin family protein n=1 Tax=Hymenobacter sp. GOD-10R TaxID=3093922 RepID=UPI002D786C1E|nr:Hsp20/alpha crystallin family protein [Hymenobacter sp. GOD-10R]WRQ29012.1 Hsp20/alpha crystallin family protein [Hymenobacter sp. GOD-10R]